MDSAGASSSPIKSNKHQTRTRASGETLKTPEKTSQPLRKALTRRHALRSVKQAREAANRVRKLSTASGPVTFSAASNTKIEITKPNGSKLLPEKYKMLIKFFHCLGSSVRLLRLKGSKSTFTNISRQVEILTDRTFGYTHLAQIKFILPEVIEIKKILVRDDRTSCMKPDLFIGLDLSIVQKDENRSSDSANLLVNKLFRFRLVRFLKSNPQGVEVPEYMLPEPFNRSSRSTSSTAIQKPDLDLVQDTTLYEQQPMPASHMPQSFKRRFSKQVENEFEVLTPVIQVDHCSIKVASVSDDLSSSARLPETPVQSAWPPARGVMTPDEESTMSPRKLTRRATGKRLFDTPVKRKTPPVKRVSTDGEDDDLSDILSPDLLALIKEKELKASEDKKPEISQAKWRKQMISRLPKLFDTLLFYFQSTKRDVITKQDLVNMIISNQLEIVDPREVDEQLRLLLELAPEWVFEKIASSGDLLFCVKKISSPEAIRTRLLEANLEN